MKPLCVLDFYVDHKVQRGGYGKTLFEAMLEHERQVPAKLAYDRPSPKLISFMAKHYGLKSYVPQNNNYVVFDEYYRQAAALSTPADVMRETVEAERIQNERRKANSATPYERFSQNQKQISAATTSIWNSRENLKAQDQGPPAVNSKEHLQMMMSGHANKFQQSTYYAPSRPIDRNTMLPPRNPVTQTQSATNATSFHHNF